MFVCSVDADAFKAVCNTNSKSLICCDDDMISVPPTLNPSAEPDKTPKLFNIGNIKELEKYLLVGPSAIKSVESDDKSIREPFI